MALPSLSKAARMILVGAPGVGKGTQTERLMKKFPDLSSISSGDLLRKNVRERTPLGMSDYAEDMTCLMRCRYQGRVHDENRRSGSGPHDTTTHCERAYNARMDQRQHAAPICCIRQLDGNGRYDSGLGPHSVRTTSITIHLLRASLRFFHPGWFPPNCGASNAAGCDRAHQLGEIIIDRICNRWVHEPSGRVYNTTFNAPKVEGKDDVTGEPLTRRADDDPEVWKERLKRFKENNEPLLEHYDKLGVLWTVNGNSSDEITPKLFEEFNKRFGAEV
jgi:adenylate kinase